jgi:hypothetical protein
MSTYSYPGSVPFTLLFVSPLRMIGSITNNIKTETIFKYVCLLLMLSYLYLCCVPVYKRDIRKKREQRQYKWNYRSNCFFFLITSLSYCAKEKRRVPFSRTPIVIPYDLYCPSHFFFSII